MKQKPRKRIILEKEAAKLRQQWGQSETDAINLRSLLIKMGVVALLRPMSSSFSGMAIKIEQNGDVFRFMMINSDKSLGHQHFTICHELYHLFVQQNFQSQICKVGYFNKKDPEEYNADNFAAYFLMPEDAIYAIIPDAELEQSRVNIATILKMENVFSCSRKALLIRLKDLNLISPEDYINFGHSVKASAQQFGYPPYLYEKSPCDSVVGDYGEIANELFNKEIISENHFYSLMESIGVELETIEMTPDESEE